MQDNQLKFTGLLLKTREEEIIKGTEKSLESIKTHGSLVGVGVLKEKTRRKV